MYQRVLHGCVSVGKRHAISLTSRILVWYTEATWPLTADAQELRLKIFIKTNKCIKPRNNTVKLIARLWNEPDINYHSKMPNSNASAYATMACGTALFASIDGCTISPRVLLVGSARSHHRSHCNLASSSQWENNYKKNASEN